MAIPAHNVVLWTGFARAVLTGVALLAVLCLTIVACGGRGSEDESPPAEPTPAPPPPIGSPGAPGGSNEARASHTATLMPEGTILAVAGNGRDRDLTSVESFDPATGLWTLAAPLSQARQAHTATLLADGRLVVAGGSASARATSSTEIYDPTAGSWTIAAPMAVPRAHHTATLLHDGRLLVTGGSAETLAHRQHRDLRPFLRHMDSGP